MIYSTKSSLRIDLNCSRFSDLKSRKVEEDVIKKFRTEKL